LNFDENLDEFIIKVWPGVIAASLVKKCSEEEFIFLCTKICFHRIRETNW
jgi:hypothetical protein